jgi:hypothetical protein
MKTSLPLRKNPLLLPTGAEPVREDLGQYISESPVGVVRRVQVRRRAIQLDARRIAAIRAYRENAELV